MSSRRVMMFDDEDIGGAANQIKEIVTGVLVSQGKLSQEDADEFNLNYAIIVVKKGWLGAVIDKALGLDQDGKRVYKVIHVCPDITLTS